jgi:hypothetical protein
MWYGHWVNIRHFIYNLIRPLFPNPHFCIPHFTVFYTFGTKWNSLGNGNGSKIAQFICAFCSIWKQKKRMERILPNICLCLERKIERQAGSNFPILEKMPFIHWCQLPMYLEGGRWFS